MQTEDEEEEGGGKRGGEQECGMRALLMLAWEVIEMVVRVSNHTKEAENLIRKNVCSISGFNLLDAIPSSV